MKIRMMSTGAAHEVDQVGVFTPKHEKLPALGPGEVGFITAGIKEVADCQIGDTITEERRPAAGPAGLQAQRAGGLLRPLPDRCGGFRAAAREPGQAAPQRCELPFRAGELGGAGLRLPLRLPRPAASRDHPGAARARVQPRPDHHRAQRRLSRPSDRRHR